MPTSVGGLILIELNDRRIYDKSLDQTSKLEVISLVAKSDLNLMGKLMYGLAQPGIISRLDTGTKVEVPVEF